MQDSAEIMYHVFPLRLNAVVTRFKSTALEIVLLQHLNLKSLCTKIMLFLILAGFSE